MKAIKYSNLTKICGGGCRAYLRKAHRAFRRGNFKGLWYLDFYDYCMEMEEKD